MDSNDWAIALDHFWGDREPGSHALLMLEKSLLLEVAAYVDESFYDVEEAEEDFVTTVKSYLNCKGQRTWKAEPYYPERPPRFLLQIGIQIYAASKMEADSNGEYTANAYHVQLEKLLGECLSSRRFNMNMQAEYHQELWRVRLGEWITQKKLFLNLPEDGDGYRSHVSLPLSQMALRANDLLDLPNFFNKANFRPTNFIAKEQFDESQIARIPIQLHRFKQDSRCFSSWARNVLINENKYEVAVHQIEEVLRNWDGRLRLPTVRRGKREVAKKSRWIWLAVDHCRSRLKAFSGRSLVTAKPISKADLTKLFSGEAVGRDRIIMWRGTALFRYDEEDAAFKLTPYVDPGDRGLLVIGPQYRGNANQLLISESIFDSTRLYSAEDNETHEILSGIPEGCCLIEFRLTDRLPIVESIPEIWRSFLRLPPAGLYLSGGLRIGREEKFVVGAGPRLKITGNGLPAFILVDGERVKIDGHTIMLDQFSLPGKHEIIASFNGNQIVKKFEVSHPFDDVPSGLPDRSWMFVKNQWPKWTSTDRASDDAQEVISKTAPRLFGVLSQGFDSCNTAATDVEDDRLTAIRLLSGMPLTDASNIQTNHPLVQHLLGQYFKQEKEAII